MGKRLHLNPAAEKEATAVGRRFMNSTDVVGDMSRAYGADLSSVRIHTDESAAHRAAERGVDAYSTGKDVFFARGVFDKSDPASRGLLAHELSHSLQQGVGGGDMGGLTQSAPMGAEQGGLISWFRKLFGKKKAPEEPNPEDQLRFTSLQESPRLEDYGRFFIKKNSGRNRVETADPASRGLKDQLEPQLSDESRYGNGFSEAIKSPNGETEIKGLLPGRILTGMTKQGSGGLNSEEVGDLFDKLMGASRYRYLKEKKELTPEEREELDGYTPERLAGLQPRFDEGIMQLKGIQLAKLRELKEKYGLYMSQMHPEDFVTRAGKDLFDDVAGTQDYGQMLDFAGKYFDFENNADDREYRDLAEYYLKAYLALTQYAQGPNDRNVATDADFDLNKEDMKVFKEEFHPEFTVGKEDALRAYGTRGFTDQQQKEYNKRLRKRFGRKNRYRLFGRFL